MTHITKLTVTEISVIEMEASVTLDCAKQHDSCLCAVLTLCTAVMTVSEVN